MQVFSQGSFKFCLVILEDCHTRWGTWKFVMPAQKTLFENKIDWHVFYEDDLEYTKIDIKKYCKDQDTELCLLKFKTTSFSLYLMVIYRAPTGNFNLFLNRLDDSIKSIYRTNSNMILCGDINIDHLTENDKKRRLDSVLQTYNLTAIVNLPTRSQSISNTTIDNIFIDNSKISKLYGFSLFQQSIRP